MSESGLPTASTSITLIKWIAEWFPKERCSIDFRPESFVIPSWTKRQSESFARVEIRNTSDFDLREIEIRSNKKDLKIIEQRGDFSLTVDGDHSVVKLPLLQASTKAELILYSSGWGKIQLELFRGGRKHVDQFTFRESVAQWLDSFNDGAQSLFSKILPWILLLFISAGLMFWYGSWKATSSLEDHNRLITKAAQRAESDFLRLKDPEEIPHEVHGQGCGSNLSIGKLNGLDDTKYLPFDRQLVVCDTKYLKKK
jgi:hypothetical protein